MEEMTKATIPRDIQESSTPFAADAVGRRIYSPRYPGTTEAQI